MSPCCAFGGCNYVGNNIWNIPGEDGVTINYCFKHVPRFLQNTNKKVKKRGLGITYKPRTNVFYWNRSVRVAA